MRLFDKKKLVWLKVFCDGDFYESIAAAKPVPLIQQNI